ncbi:MAG: hypothetical protein ABIE68_01010 [bacterium]
MNIYSNKQSQKGVSRQVILVVILIVLIVGFGFFWYFTSREGGFSLFSSSEDEFLGTKTEIRLAPIDANLNDGVLDDERFKALKEGEDIKIEVGETGRDNPFVQ